MNETRVRPFQIVCVGGAVLDRKYRGLGPLLMGTSNPAAGERSYGGVARNVAENLARLGVRVSLLSLLGDDAAGRAVLDHTAGVGVDVSACQVLPGERTAEYVAVLQPNGELLLALADMAIFDALTPGQLEGRLNSDFVFADCNLPAETLEALIRRGAPFRLALDAVSVPKAAKLPPDLRGVDLLFLNRDQGAALTGEREPAEVARALQERGAASVVLTLGPGGVVVAAGETLSHLPAPKVEVVDVTGAGDALIAGTLYGLLRGGALPEAARLGQRAARLALESGASVPPDLSPERLGPDDLGGPYERP